jgi:hypothetical protein
MRQPLPARPAAGTEALEDEEVGDGVDDGEGISPTAARAEATAAAAARRQRQAAAISASRRCTLGC